MAERSVCGRPCTSGVLLLLLVLSTSPFLPGGASAAPLAGDAPYMEIKVLHVIYRNFYNTEEDQAHVSDADVEKLKVEIEDGVRFFFRNSRFGVHHRVEYLEIERTLALEDFARFGEDGYWLGTRPVAADLEVQGIPENAYGSVFVWYAWHQGDGTNAAFGGGTYGVDAILDRATYTAVPLCWNPDTNDWYLVHEWHHALDSILNACGHPEFPHADQPGNFHAEPIDNGADFTAAMLRAFPAETYLDIHAPWGEIQSAPDADGDGLPDASSGLPINEGTEGADDELADTDGDGLLDAEEAVAGIHRGSSPTDPDTDGDGLTDDEDPYPIYGIDERVLPGSPAIDGQLTPGEYGHTAAFEIDPPEDLAATFWMAWSPAAIYLGAEIIDDRVKMDYADPWWCDGIRIRLDGSGDGFLGHGDDNLEIWITPRGAAGVPDVFSRVRFASDGDWHDDVLPASELDAAYVRTPAGYTVEIGIPAAPQIGLVLGDGAWVRMEVKVLDYDSYPGWPAYNWTTGEELDEPFAELRLLVPPASPDGIECEYLDGKVELSWTNPMTYDHIEVLRDGDVLAIMGGEETGYLDLSPIPGNRTYGVRGVRVRLESEPATCEVSVASDGPHALQCEPQGAMVRLAWENPVSYTGIRVSRDGSPLVTLPGTATSYEDHLAPGGMLSYEVVGLHDDAESPPASCVVPLVLFVRGDCNGDRRYTIEDAIVILLGVYAGRELECARACDVDGSGNLGAEDALGILHRIFADAFRAELTGDCVAEPVSPALPCASSPCYK